MYLVWCLSKAGIPLQKNCWCCSFSQPFAIQIMFSPSKFPLHMWRPEPHPIQGSLGPPVSAPQTKSQSVHRFCRAQDCDRPTEQTDSYSACNNSPHLPTQWTIKSDILLWSPYGIGQTIIVCPVVTSFFFSSPNLSRRTLDVCHTDTHGVALVRIPDAGLKPAARGSMKTQDAKRSTKIAIWAPSHNFVGLYLRN